MRRRISIAAITAMVLFLVGCGGTQSEPINQASDLVGKVIGDITSAAPPEAYQALLTAHIGGAAQDVKFFNRPSDVIAAITTGKIDAAPVMSYMAEYYVKRNSQLKMVEAAKSFPVDVVMFLRAEDSLLKNDLDLAITTLQDNGTLAKLKETWITNLPIKDEPMLTEMPKIEGAKTVFVGLTGDYLPLDYMAADGRPAGFNVAFLSEISKLLNINFELVSLETQAKFQALGSKKIDVVFSQTYNEQMAALFGDKLIRTKSYFSDKGRCFLVKN